VSGGQTGADRAALDFAISKKIPHGGWCPKGRWAEDGPIDLRYHLKQTPRKDPAQRTEWNVRDSDGTAIFSLRPHLVGGAAFTLEVAARHSKPRIHLYWTYGTSSRNVSPSKSSQNRQAARAARLLGQFLQKWRIRILNVAGPRQSEEPGVGDFVREILERVFG
jgi:hypothetical protein